MIQWLSVSCRKVSIVNFCLMKTVNCCSNNTRMSFRMNYFDSDHMHRSTQACCNPELRQDAVAQWQHLTPDYLYRLILLTYNIVGQACSRSLNAFTVQVQHIKLIHQYKPIPSYRLRRLPRKTVQTKAQHSCSRQLTVCCDTIQKKAPGHLLGQI